MKKTILAASIAIALLVGAAPARACCGDGAAAAAGAETAGAMVAGAIESSKLVIVAWLERLNITIATGFGKVMAEIQRQTASIRAMEEGNAAVQSQFFMERARAEAQVKYELSPRICFETAGGASATVAAGEVKETLNELNRDFARRTMFTPNTSAAVRRLYDEHATKYCSAQDEALGRCTAVDSQLQNADVRADAALNTASYTPAQIDAARAFVNNVANPMPTQNIPMDWERTAQGKMFVAGQYVEQARGSVAANSLNAAIAARTPVQGLGTAAMLNKADVSELELMESQVRGRFESPGWYSMIAGFSLENLQREVVKIRALQARMDLAEYRRMERIEAVLATQLAIAVKQDSEQRQRELRAAAAKAGQ